MVIKLFGVRLDMRREVKFGQLIISLDLKHCIGLHISLA